MIVCIYIRTYVRMYICMPTYTTIYSPNCVFKVIIITPSHTHARARAHTHTHTNTHARIVHKKPLKCPLQLYGSNYNQAQFEALFIPVTASRSHNRPCSFPLQPRGHTSVPEYATGNCYTYWNQPYSKRVQKSRSTKLSYRYDHHKYYFFTLQQS